MGLRDGGLPFGGAGLALEEGEHDWLRLKRGIAGSFYRELVCESLQCADVAGPRRSCDERDDASSEPGTLIAIRLL